MQNVLLWRDGRPLTGLVLVVGLLATAWGVVTLERNAYKRSLQAFQARANQYFARTLHEIQTYMEVLDSIRHIHSLSESVQGEAFEEIAGKGMLYQRHVLGAYGFAQALPGGIRPAYEAQVAAIVRHDEGAFAADEERPVYYPLVYQAPPGALGLPNGYNFASQPEDAQAIQTMERAGIFAIGSGGLPDDRRLMFAPILYVDEVGRPLGLRGFAISLFQPMRLLASAARDEANPLPARLQPAGEEPSETEESAWHFRRSFLLADQTWEFVIEADEHIRAAFHTRAPEQAAAAGVLATLLICALFWMFASRTRRIEALVEKRTAQLAQANTQRHELETEILRIASEERARVGRDLHDSVGQKLTGALYLFSAYSKAHPAPEGGVITETLKTAVSQIRRIARGLAPVELSEEGLPDALQQMADESSGLFSCNVEFFLEGDGRPCSAAAAEHLFLIAQEAVHNACRHGNPARVLVMLEYTPAGGTLVIEDDGPGLSPGAQEKSGGNGLRLMQHRAELIGGRLTLSASPLGGVMVVCDFPAAE